MTARHSIPASAWRAATEGFVVEIAAPGAGGLAILAEGWADPGAVRLVPAQGAAIAFLALSDSAFVAVTAERGTRFTIEAPSRPLSCQVRFLAHPATSPSLALFAPRAIRSPARRPAYDLEAGRERVTASLAAQELDAALGVAAEMLAAARSAAATRGAVTAVLGHLARYPLARSPSLGAFVAALTE
ncbi:hypothetical protein [Neoroseomonas lacus]|uniref:Uncharacterized protein n=1 Tax=Neoroseomonas lacus TaxID=287609 RepID=A0A917NML7_9PROT|nr:hypothetical protein [Neoroseomonas lacus]GGJ11527.1 hypothetical protein GCM10011320_18210 [Neoroseomonas lacus]